MAMLQIAYTDGVDPRRVEAMIEKLPLPTARGQPQIIVFASADTASLPIFVQLLGEAAAWLPLVAGATAFFTAYMQELGKKAGGATWEKISDLLKRPEVAPLARTASALSEVAADAEPSMKIIVGIDVPDRNFGTSLIIRGRSAEEIAVSLAAFVSRVNELSEVMKHEVEGGNRPLGPAHIHIENDGSLSVRWLRQSDLRNHEITIPKLQCS